MNILTKICIVVVALASMVAAPVFINMATVPENYKSLFEQEKASYGLPTHVVANELIIQLIDDVEPTTWVKKYAKQKMTVVKSLPNGLYWVVKYNTEIMPPREMLGFIRKDDFVLSAEFNRRK